jgi:hypothetical protein
MKLFASRHQSRFFPGQMASGALLNQQSATPIWNITSNIRLLQNDIPDRRLPMANR